MTGVWLVLTFRWNAHLRRGREQQSITCRAVERLERSSARFTAAPTLTGNSCDPAAKPSV